jgi:hypothetical protein
MLVICQLYSKIQFCRDVANAFNAGNLDAAKQELIKMQYYASIGERIKELKQKTGIE